jgi:hypothetical protein
VLRLLALLRQFGDAPPPFEGLAPAAASSWPRGRDSHAEMHPPPPWRLGSRVMTHVAPQDGSFPWYTWHAECAGMSVTGQCRVTGASPALPHPGQK